MVLRPQSILLVGWQPVKGVGREAPLALAFSQGVRGVFLSCIFKPLLWWFFNTISLLIKKKEQSLHSIDSEHRFCLTLSQTQIKKSALEIQINHNKQCWKREEKGEKGGDRVVVDQDQSLHSIDSEYKLFCHFEFFFGLEMRASAYSKSQSGFRIGHILGLGGTNSRNSNWL